MASYSDIVKTETGWIDLVDEDSNLSATAVTIQNKSSRPIFLFEGGGSEPSETDAGILLERFAAVNVNNANIWVRGSAGFKVGIIDTV